MAKKVKGKRKPKLHSLDKTIYNLLIIFSIFIAFALIVLMNCYGKQLSLQDETVIAYRVNGGKYMLPLCIYCALVIPTYAGIRLEERIPLFKPLQYYGVKKNATEKIIKSKKIKTANRVLIAVAVVCVGLAFIPDAERWTMDNTGIINEYSSKNELKNSYVLSPDNTVSLKLSTVYPIGKYGSPNVKFSAKLADGTKKKIWLSDFVDNEQAVCFMEDFVVGIGDDTAFYANGRFLSDAADYYNLTVSQESRLQALFEMSR